MSMRLFLHMILLRKWYILSAAILTPVAAVVFLLFAEPIFVSQCKLQVVDRMDDRDPTKVVKPTLKDDTYIQSQVELIFTDMVMAKVVDKVGLIPPPPSQSMYAKLTKSKPATSDFSGERLRIETIRGVKKSVSVDVISPVVMRISARMNTPELAQSTAQAVYDSYIEEFGRIQKESGELRKIYDERLKSVQLLIDDCEKELREFHTKNSSSGLAVPNKPLVIGDIPKSQTGQETLANPNGDGTQFIPGAKEFNPLQRINQEKALLELEYIKAKATLNEDSYQVKRLKEQLVNTEKLLQSYQKDLTTQNVLAVKERELNWRLEGLHASYNSIMSDRDRIEGNMIVKESLKGTIIVLDKPTFDPASVFPKRTTTVIAAAFAGLVLGLAMAYIAHVLDATYHLPEDFSADTGLPVLAAIPAQ